MLAALVITLLTPLAAAAATPFSLTSADFTNGAPIPVVHEAHAAGCTGQNETITLSWSGAPAGTKSFALLMVDPDAPKKVAPTGFTHWVAYNIPSSATGIAPTTSYSYSKGKNGLASVGYLGPCPPKGDKPHHYHITLYALSLAHIPGTALTRVLLQKAMKGNIINHTTLIGTFQRT
jgi:Raf kinase inhibitor-like YbhB/YbcL family protein